MPVTIYDVANAAGVGISTVSRVLNENTNVRQETRTRVLDAIEALGYKPNISARNLSRSHIRTVGVVLSYLTSPFQVAVLQGIERFLAQAGLDLTIFSLESPKRRETLLENLSHGRRCDGLIVVSFTPQERFLQRFQRYHIPVVIADFADERVPSVFVDNVEGGYLATKHLLRLGHTRIGYILDHIDLPNGSGGNEPGADRQRGYQQALEEAGIPFDPKLVLESGLHSREKGAEAAARLLAQAERPTAIFAASDMIALGVMEYARLQGLNIPKELAVVGFDDIELASFAGLTTVRQPMQEMGRQAAEIVTRLMDGEKVVRTSRQLPVELVIRESCGALLVAERG
ncbi:MAG: LacI family DNA-binding transcriptional regulator [Caldilineaceae bacterium]|nr:LacI family DNA-binding transcriptional regulator [Caldilineaceae bacterium]